MDETQARSTSWGRQHRRVIVSLALTVASMLGAFLQPGIAHAAVRQEIPGEQAGPPFYARVLSSVRGAEEVSAVVFYRDPACIPDDFNLLQFFDVPRAFGCQLTVEGFVVWKNGPPPQDQAPIQQELFEAPSVPVWFVATSELSAAVADGSLTIDELAALPSLVVGSASSFHETLHPTQGARIPMIQINATGSLAEGGTFELRGVAAVYEDLRNGHVRITFR